MDRICPVIGREQVIKQILDNFNLPTASKASTTSHHRGKKERPASYPVTQVSQSGKKLQIKYLNFSCTDFVHVRKYTLFVLLSIKKRDPLCGEMSMVTPYFYFGFEFL